MCAGGKRSRKRLDHVDLGIRVVGGDHPDPAREAGERAAPAGVSEPLRLKLAQRLLLAPQQLSLARGPQLIDVQRGAAGLPVEVDALEMRLHEHALLRR